MRFLPIPVLLQHRSNDEYWPLAWTKRDLLAVRRTVERAETASDSLWSQREFAASRRGTATALRAIDEAWGGGYYTIDPKAETDPEAADEAFGGDELVIDVQTHYIARHRAEAAGVDGIMGFICDVAPDRWQGLDPAIHLDLGNYLRHIFLESETAAAVLTCTPGDDRHSILTNPEITATRELIDRLAGTGRLINHSIVHPNAPGELDEMDTLMERGKPAGWKVYTIAGWGDQRGWRLDDEEYGLPFLERSRDLGVGIVCAHKGLSALARAGSPADIGPAAACFPDIDFLVYHSGYETPVGDDEEGPYDGQSPTGTDRLIKSLDDAGLGPGSNVYAELGSTWYVLSRRPREAAHVIGKLLKAVGEDNVLWGSDSIWYGSPQPLIDAFRAFQIPEELRQRHGYPELTSGIKEKILGLNAARVYGIDPDLTRRRTATDDLSWVKAAFDEYTTNGGFE
ncbi:MAG: amidohydrolase family protein [bacterium]|nr:amidohydrolase family protein [bacterium]MCY3632703.1 amidohydrolase family protein [bacterium]